MNQVEKALLILKSKFSDNDDLMNTINAIIQLKRPEILLTQEEEEKFHKYALEWYRKGWIIYTSATDYKGLVKEPEE